MQLVADCDLTFLHVFPFSPRKGTPAARMPQVPGPEVKSRAARLRVCGEAGLDRHLTAQIGRDHSVLIEGPRLGRTPQFAEVSFASDQPEGRIVQARILGKAAGRLTA